MSDLDEAERAASGEYQTPRGQLLITAPIMFGKLHVLPVVLEFLRAYPDVNVRLVLPDAVVDLVDNHVDVAAQLGRLPDSGLIAMQVGEVRWITCASPAYLAQRGTPKMPADLDSHACLAFEGLQMLRSWSFGPGSGHRLVAIRPRLAVNTADALIEAAEAGLGGARMISYQAGGRSPPRGSAGEAPGCLGTGGDPGAPRPHRSIAGSAQAKGVPRLRRTSPQDAPRDLPCLT